MVGPILFLYFLKFIIALFKWGHLTSFHTHAAKPAAFVLVTFLGFTFFFGVWEGFSWVTVGVSCLDLLEELSLTLLLKKHRTGIKSVLLLKKYQRKD